MPQFERLSNSSMPFLCYACFQEDNRAKVLSLEEKVAALTIELTDLKTVLDGRRKAESNTWTEVKRGRRMQIRGGGRTNRNESRTNYTAVNANVQQEGPLTRARTGENVRSDENARTDTGKSRPSNTSTSIQRTPINGVRRIWGTLKSTTPAAVSSTLKKLSPSSDRLVVRRKVREYDNSNKTRWWFILRGDETILKKWEGDWERIQVQTLEYCTAPNNQSCLDANNDHGSANTNNSSTSPGAPGTFDATNPNQSNTSQTIDVDTNSFSISDPQSLAPAPDSE